MTGVHDQAARRAVLADVLVSHQEASHLFDRPLSGRQPDACHGPIGQSAQTFHREGKVGAALVVGHGVYLIQDQGLYALEAPAAAFRGEKDVQRLGSGYQDVRRLLGHLLPLSGFGVPGANGGADLREGGAPFFGQG